MSRKIKLTDKEKYRLTKAAPYLKSGEWDEAFQSISNYYTYDDRISNASLHILEFLNANDIDLLHKVTVIPRHAFRKCSQLESVKMPNNIIEICDNAFDGCKSLKEIEISYSVTKIGYGAFASCKLLPKITIPNGVKIISGYMFSGCEALQEVNLPNSITRIYWFAFGNCKALQEVKYDGTKEQWNAIDKDKTWSSGSAIKTISCSDGSIQLNE